MGHDRQAAPCSKVDVVGKLAQRFGYRNYLEVCTPSTGNEYAQVQDIGFASARRLMYLSPLSFSDGMKLDFQCPDEDITDAVSQLQGSGIGIDICLVDGWHRYETACRDIAAVSGLLADGGAMVVHDCLPPNREVASPRFRRGAWCGVSYKAYLDFVLGDPSLDYFTVDCDYGCGVIFKGFPVGDDWKGLVPACPDASLVRAWLGTKDDHDAAFDLFEQHKSELLRLVSTRDFEAMLAAGAGPP